jgi:hypothetical protein
MVRQAAAENDLNAPLDRRARPLAQELPKRIESVERKAFKAQL